MDLDNPFRHLMNDVIHFWHGQGGRVVSIDETKKFLLCNYLIEQPAMASARLDSFLTDLQETYSNAQASSFSKWDSLPKENRPLGANPFMEIDDDSI